jgi:hypothetical protein
MVWATKFGPSGLAPRGGCCCSIWTSYCYVWKIWHNIPFWAAMNASTIFLGGGGGRSLPLLDTPKPSRELHAGLVIWKNWAFIKYTSIILFSQAEHVWRKTQLEQKFDCLELRILCAQLKTTRIHDSKLQTNAKVWSNLISNLESKAKAITLGRIGYGVQFWWWGQKFPTQTPESQNFPNFHQQPSGIIMHTFDIQR